MQPALPDGPRCYCDACERVRPASGFERVGGYLLCNVCVGDYAFARQYGLAATPGQYVRARRFGDIGEFTLELATS